MAVDDFIEPEVAVAVAVTAAVCSPPVRRVLRRGVVYGLAGLLIAKDKVTDAAKTVAKNVQEAATETTKVAAEANQAASATA